VSALADQVLAHVRSNPGRRLEEIARDLGMSTNDLKQPVAKLLEASAVRREGKARGTKYYAGGGGKRKAAKKAGRKATAKTATRKKAKAKRAAKKTRRKLSPEQKAVLVERLAKARAAKQAKG
jgi:DNA-binding MarR family transcriptional regulator